MVRYGVLDDMIGSRNVILSNTDKELEVWGSQPTVGPGEYDHYLPHAENILLVGARGPGTSSTYVLYPHQASSISCEVTYDGSAGRLESFHVG